MKYLLLICFICQLGFSQEKENATFTIAFGSCNKHNVNNDLWDDVLLNTPDVWVWGGDIVYADTDKMGKLKRIYKAQNRVKGYKKLKETMPVIGTWDDHDYGLNDGGLEFKAKKESQQAFLDFMGVSKESPRRKQEGVYSVHNYKTGTKSVKILVLDTRYFRSGLTKDTETKKRFKPNVGGKGTVLGSTQWQWLENELKNSKADFNILISSIQFLSYEHGFESWGNFPNEVTKLKELIVSSKAKAVMILSGDRHISEFSKTAVDGLNYPLIDFTSSGLTHSYTSFSGEKNDYRVGEVVSEVSFGTVILDFEKNTAELKIIGDNNKMLQLYKLVY